MTRKPAIDTTKGSRVEMTEKFHRNEEQNKPDRPELPGSSATGFISPPYLSRNASVRRVMVQVLAALLPGIVVYAALIGPAIVLQLSIASVTALLAEAAMLKLRGRALFPFLTDGSALVTAWLIALTFPPIAPWWLTVIGVLMAIVITKHLYGGLGQNPFNPAMAGFAACLVSFPALMSQWPSVTAPAHFIDQAAAIFGGARSLDALTSATPLDALKTALRLAGPGATVSAALADTNIYGYVAGRAWEWVAAAYLLGGLWLAGRKIIRWHAPAGFLSGLALISAACWLSDPERFASPLFHVFSGGALLGAFFIVTDPVSGCISGKGKFIFGFSAGILAYIIRVFGGYPDGVAFAVLILNLCAPLIDALTRPPIFGMKKK
ncbi:MAG: RnfABCDGE type electron transport complex subunit D [Candidatus Accumulibacter sp.]|jgi:electron transport complex protein RnfD|nr:RnfABCDGE type electron transport complex subunit D [Accumulibacter sp.]